LAYAAHVYENSPLAPRPYSADFAELPPSQGFAVERILEGELHGPECTAFDNQGFLYTGVMGGAVYRVNLTTLKPELYARLSADIGEGCMEEEDVCGRALGLEMDADGQLVMATTFGIQRVRKDGVVETLLTSVAGKPLRFANSLVILKDGSIVFTDSTTRWTRSTWRYAAFEAAFDGRVIRFHPSNPKGAQVLREGVFFANGIALLPDESAVLYHELGTGSLHRLSLSTLEDTVLFANFPGFLDNLHRSPRDTYLSAVPALHTPATRMLLQAPPYIRKAFTLFVPKALLYRVVPQVGAWIEFDAQGRVLSFHRNDGGLVTFVTDAREHDGVMYLGSLENHFLGRVVKQQA